MTALEELKQFMAFPSISADPSHKGDVRACAEWLCHKLASLGLSAQVNETPGHPIVTARSQRDPKKHTVLIYGHYDVQPVDPIDQWRTSPFEMTVQGTKIFGRGSVDDKGPLYTHVRGVQELLEEKGELPVNVIFIFEGEEESGSTNIGQFIADHKEDLACDIVLLSDTGMIDVNCPNISYGLRGLAACEVTIKGPSSDLHSGQFGGSVQNPATALCQLIHSLHDSKHCVAIEGFYDDVRPLESWEREMWAKVPGYTDDDILRNTGAPAVLGEEGYTSAERLWARPTAEVNGIYGGYEGPGSKTIVPAEATAKLSFRLVPDQSAADILTKVEEHCRKNLPEGVTLEFKIGHYGDPYIVNPKSDYVKAACTALKEAFQAEPVMIREGGSIGVIADFKKYLGVDSLLLGLDLPDCKMHAPNENFDVRCFEGGIRLSKSALRHIGALPKA